MILIACFMDVKHMLQCVNCQDLTNEQTFKTLYQCVTHCSICFNDIWTMFIQYYSVNITFDFWPINLVTNPISQLLAVSARLVVEFSHWKFELIHSSLCQKFLQTARTFRLIIEIAMFDDWLQYNTMLWSSGLQHVSQMNSLHYIHLLELWSVPLAQLFHLEQRLLLFCLESSTSLCRKQLMSDLS